MRLLLLAAVIASASTTVFAQGTNRTPNPTDADMVNRELARGKGNIVTPISGSPFLLPYWALGSVQMTSGTVPRPLLKYDLAGERLLWQRPTGDSLELNTDGVTAFSLRDSLHRKTYTYRRYLSARIQALALRTSFFEVLYDAGHSALLRRRNRTLFHGSNGPSLLGHPGDRWIETVVFYIKNADNAITPVRLNEKDVLATLGKAKAPALTAFAAREHLELNTETDVIRLLQYYDSL